jgi:hypothetical protein
MKLPLNELAREVGEHIDVLFCCASFEERCRSIPDHLDLESVGRVVVFKHSTNDGLTEVNALYIAQRFEGRSRVYDIDISDPLETADGMSAAVAHALTDGATRVLVDITTFTHEGVLMLLNLLARTTTDQQSIQIAYTGAGKYMLGDNPQDQWLSAGYGEIRSVLGYPGEMLPSRNAHLVVLVGFEVDRASMLISGYEPAVLSLGRGEESLSITPEHYERNRDFHRKLLSIYRNVDEFTFAPNDPEHTKQAILRQALRYPEYNTVVAAMNTKLSTVGVALAALENPSIQLCYLNASIYNRVGYSVPDTQCYLYDLPWMGTRSLEPMDGRVLARSASAGY